MDAKEKFKMIKSELASIAEELNSLNLSYNEHMSLKAKEQRLKEDEHLLNDAINYGADTAKSTLINNLKAKGYNSYEISNLTGVSLSDVCKYYY